MAIFGARDALISSMSAASVVDFPDPVGPEMMTKPVGASISLRRSGCRLHALRSLMDGAKSLIAIAIPRTVRKKLARHRAPEMVIEISAEPRTLNCAQPSAPNKS